MRFVPRFSLRFLLLAVTLFVIVFGVGVKYWKRAEAHQEYAKKLAVPRHWLEYEETAFTLAGYDAGKQLPGLHLHDYYRSEDDPPDDSPTASALFNELPNPGELRRLAFLYSNYNRTKPNIDLILPKLRQCTELEWLQLHNFVFDSAQMQELGALRRLRILDLAGCKIPAGGLACLQQMPQLEILRLNYTGAAVKELLALDLPRLRVVDISGHDLRELDLTRAGWGKFPALETLIMSYAKLQRVNAEAGALPKLRHLDLNLQGRACQIDWAALAAAAPQLEALALHVSQYGPSTDRALQQLPRLQTVHFCINSLDDDWSHQPRLTWFHHKQEKVYVLESQEPLLKAWIARSEAVTFYQAYLDFLQAISPREMHLAEPEVKWPSEFWKETAPVGLF